LHNNITYINAPQVAYCGLAAAGIVCLALLSKPFSRANKEASVPKTVRDLSVLVAEVEIGTLVQPRDPDYALLSSAARTIKNLLNRLLSNSLARQPTVQPDPNTTSQLPDFSIREDWSESPSHVLHDFEVEL